jgi:hypothetical protein
MLSPMASALALSRWRVAVSFYLRNSSPAADKEQEDAVAIES